MNGNLFLARFALTTGIFGGEVGWSCGGVVVELVGWMVGWMDGGVVVC